MAVWRTLPEFPKYEITADGDVRNKWTYKVLKEVENKRTGAWAYSLRREDGTSTCRNFWGLIYSAWPELKPENENKYLEAEKTPKRRYVKRGGWLTIPSFPKYQIHPEGAVRNASRRRVEIQKDGEEEYVFLKGEDNRLTTRSINQLLAEVSPCQQVRRRNE